MLLLDLPPEILEGALFLLSNADIKNLRLACTHLGQVARLRLNRVFLSLNPLDIQVLRNVAGHETYRHHITELIYDDTRFPTTRELDEDVYETSSDSDNRADGQVPTWYKRKYQEIREELADHKGEWVERPHHILRKKQYESRPSLRQSYHRYQKVASDQGKVRAAGGDVKAFEHALECFPNLRKITLTPVAHGVPFRPLYETPMIRNLPYGFIYPVPCSWPGSESESGHDRIMPPWDDEREKRKWRGLRVVLRTLTERPHGITEFVIDVNQLRNGVSCSMFDTVSHNQEYEDLVSVLQSPGFSRLDLALSTGDQRNSLWPCYRSGLLRQALGEAKDLRHVSLATGLIVPASAYSPDQYDGGGEEHFFPLRTIFPLDQLRQLRHFGLSRFIVKRNDIVNFLSTMPPTLRSIELSFLFFMKSGEGQYRELLHDMKDRLDWRERPESQRPSITLYLDSEPPADGHCIDISVETEAFVYHGGENPFIDGPNLGDRVYRSQGVGIKRDMFNPDNDVPFAPRERLMDMGILEPDYFYRNGIQLRP
ncbi:uncharacterized protein F5Z01DRAFT_638258 [Emericellopsis atlantica]|uniref:F-box domain-containing protein n=1 Tax=Emericellopsis atlantica TaxID=2614577 RepID=A0A9P7ZIG1_9HYPO|nr:uncharacterized protein F5Z01DRAFT_638258 [Emericellopsis atlantica]KAG9252382.1 hypothetical protein F5Z01DRAFT_638258 [Emericellopsis atlantica]